MQPELQNQQPYQPPVPQQTNAAISDSSVPQQQSIGSGQQPANQTPKAQAPKDKKKNAAISTQNTLLFSEMRENMIIMSDGSFRAVVECQSINFDLMSAREREGVEFSYQNFLNSLYFPVQILIRSRRVDIGPYLDRLAEIRRNQDNMLLNVLMDDYMDFIDVLAQEANIMDKSFYVVVPYYQKGDESVTKQQAKGLFNSFFSGKKEASVTKIDQVTYAKAKDEIKNRLDSVMSGMFQMGVKSRQLNTRELGELLYVSYNPDTSSRESLTAIDPSELTTTYITKGQGQPPTGGGLL
jgi:hypothetical protein cdiviTM7_00582